jgi:hypothetical protein
MGNPNAWSAVALGVHPSRRGDRPYSAHLGVGTGFGDEKLTTALLGRLGHRAHVLAISGSSYRTRKRREERGRTADGSLKDGLLGCRSWPE